MIDLVLNKRKTRDDDKVAGVSSTEKEQLSVVTPVLFFICFGICVILSIQRDYLFFSELLTAGGIIAMIVGVKMRSQKEAIRRSKS